MKTAGTEPNNYLLLLQILIIMMFLFCQIREIRIFTGRMQAYRKFMSFGINPYNNPLMNKYIIPILSKVSEG